MTLPGPRRTTITTIILALLLIGLIHPVLANNVVLDEEFVEYEFTGGTRSTTAAGASIYSYQEVDTIRFADITRHSDVSYIVLQINNDNRLGDLEEGRTVRTYTLGGRQDTAVVYVEHIRNPLGRITSTIFRIFPQNWNNEGLSGEQKMVISPSLASINAYSKSNQWVNDLAWPSNNEYNILGAAEQGFHGYKIVVSSINEWKNHLTVESTDNDNSYQINLKREYDTKLYFSKIDLKHGETIVLSDYDNSDFNYTTLKSQIDGISISSVTNTYNRSLGTGSPTDPGETSTLRTGSVTMTDHNGTTIRGFEVTAANQYTGEEYTVSTDTDLAVMNLSMDRTVEIRNPQTGVYEEAPVGYYRFYGQKAGYKMLNEEGIKVSVMPEKYGTYKLCDILVTGESGPLSGKHQFQIRSRADNSILQTGTISAKSATTGEWYNTTVSGGTATLILPYDTSDALSEHAGHYYVYATSPGYEDSDYGTQIIVSPRTVSEVKTILLTPIGGVPTPGNVTLRIDVFSEGGSGVPNAEIFIKGVIGAGKSIWDTYTASSSGYLEVSVPGNSTYDIVASGAGYYDSARRIEVFTEDPPLIEIKLYLSGAPIVEPTVEPTDWPTGPPTTQPTGGIPDEDDGSDSFLMQAVRGIGNAFGVGFSTAKIIFGMLLALAIGFATAKELRGGAAEFGLGLLGGTMLGILVGLIPVWTIVVLLLVVGLYIGHRYVGGGNNG